MILPLFITALVSSPAWATLTCTQVPENYICCNQRCYPLRANSDSIAPHSSVPVTFNRLFFSGQPMALTQAHLATRDPSSRPDLLGSYLQGSPAQQASAIARVCGVRWDGTTAVTIYRNGLKRTNTDIDIDRTSASQDITGTFRLSSAPIPSHVIGTHVSTGETALFNCGGVQSAGNNRGVAGAVGY